MGADRITQGQIFPNDLNPFDSPGSIVVDAVSGLLQVVTTSRVLQAAQAAIAAVGVQPTVLAITVAQNLYSKLLQAGILNAQSRTITVNGWGVYNSAGGTTPTISIGLVVGGVTLCTITSAAINTSANVNLPFTFNFQFTVMTPGAAGTIEAHGTLSINLTANTPGGAPTVFTDTNTAVSAPVNLTIADLLQVTIAASSNITSAQLRLGTIQILA